MGTRLNGNETRNLVEKGYQLHLTFYMPKYKRVLCMCFDMTVAVRCALCNIIPAANVASALVFLFSLRDLIGSWHTNAYFLSY